MTNTRKMFVLTNARGAIIGAGHFDPIRSDDGPVDVQIRPGKGQRVVEMPAEQVGRLSSEEDFRRLIAEYHLPRGQAKLARKRRAGSSARAARRR